MIRTVAAVAAFLCSTGAAAQAVTVVGYTTERLGAQSIMHGDYASAEREIAASTLPSFDPAKQINLGIVYAQTGRWAEAQKLFHQVMLEEPVEVQVVNGQTVMSNDVARRALRTLNREMAAR